MAGFYKYIMSSSFVCPTEILELNDAMPQFKKLDCEVLACSTDSHFSHHSWSAIVCGCLLLSLIVVLYWLHQLMRFLTFLRSGFFLCSLSSSHKQINIILKPGILIRFYRFKQWPLVISLFFYESTDLSCGICTTYAMILEGRGAHQKSFGFYFK